MVTVDDGVHAGADLDLDRSVADGIGQTVTRDLSFELLEGLGVERVEVVCQLGQDLDPRSGRPL
jgi:hypothetical protein